MERYCLSLEEIQINKFECLYLQILKEDKWITVYEYMLPMDRHYLHELFKLLITFKVSDVKYRLSAKDIPTNMHSDGYIYLQLQDENEWLSTHYYPAPMNKRYLCELFEVIADLEKTHFNYRFIL